MSSPASTSRYVLRAEADLWALIQDPSGVELDWLKMISGESVPLIYSGPISVTCSSGHKLKIFDNQKNLIETKSQPKWYFNRQVTLIYNVAERTGFEPVEGRLAPHRFSKPSAFDHSAISP